MDRRDFIRKTTGTTVAMTAASYSRVLGANNRIGLALIGCGGRGEHVMKNHLLDPGVEVVALCDVWDERIAERRQVVPGVDGLADHRAVLDRRDVDAVIVATPDHWHTDITIDAMKAGHRSAQTSILATRAYTTGRTVRFDPVKEQVLEA